MKKNILLYMAAVAGLVLAGCNKTEVPEGDPLAMTVKASIGDLTKVAYDGASTTFETDDQIAVWGWTGVPNSLPQVFAVDGVVNTLKESGKWEPAKQMLWKNVRDNHYFMAVHPVPAAPIENLLAVPYAVDNANYEASDLLLATELDGLKAASGTVDLAFAHAMAKLQVNLKFRNQFGSEGPAAETVSAALVGKSAAKVNYLTKAVTPTGAEGSVALAPMTAAATGYAMSFSGLQIPQNATKIVVTVGETTFSYTHPEPLPIEPGKVTTLGFNVGQNVILLESVTVTNWVEDDPITGGEAELETDVELSELASDYVAKGRVLLKGKLIAPVKISIADGAMVTLDGVTINGVNDANYKWAGITCEGDATIILKGDNAVMGFYQTAPGIFIPEGKTLVIKGEGSLTASTYIKDPSDIDTYGYGAGIGGGQDVSCGNIEIQGGNIEAIGGVNAAGIGTGGIENENSTNCGTIKISGGSVVATSKYQGAGIGCGYSGICNSITISGGTVEATGGYAGPGIGSTVGASSCGDITISGGTVTATTSSSSPGIGSSIEPSVCGNITISGGTVTAIGKGYSPGIGAGGNWFTGEGGKCGNITITSGVTKVTAIKGTEPEATNSIGAGFNAISCGTVTIGGVVTGNISESPYVYPLPYPIDLSEVTSAYVGSVISAQSAKVYKTVADAIADGETAVAIIAYVGAVGSVEANTEYKGLAIALTDADGDECIWADPDDGIDDCLPDSRTEDITTALGFINGITCTGTLNNSYHTDHNHVAASLAEENKDTPRPDAASDWFLPSMGQWNLIVKGLAGKADNLTESGNNNYKYSNLNSVITAAGGTGFQGGDYWTSSVNTLTLAWTFDSNSGCASYTNKGNNSYVRSAFAF